MVERRPERAHKEANKDSISPEIVLIGFSQYGLGLQLISDSLYIEEKGLLAKPNLKLPPVHPSVNRDFKDGLARLVGGLRDVGETHGYDQFLTGVALRETGLGHIRAGIRFSEGIRSPHTRFRTLLSVGSRFQLPNPDVEEALKKARATADEVGVLKDRVDALAWSGWIDKQLGAEESFAFDAADLAFRRLLEPTNQTALRDVCAAGCNMARLAIRLDKDPDYYLTVAKMSSSVITSWSEFVPSVIDVALTERTLELPHQATVARLKEKITVEDDRVRDSTIHFWLQVVELEQSVGDNWQDTLDYVRGLCSKLTYPAEVAQGFSYLAEFEARNNLDPFQSLKKSKRALRQTSKYDSVRLKFMGTKGRISVAEQRILEEQLLADDSEHQLFTDDELEVVVTTLYNNIGELVGRIGTYRNRDKRVEAYLAVASELVTLGISPIDIIDLAKYEVYSSSRPASYAHRLKMLGRYQRNIGDSLHTSACNILTQATPQEMPQALLLAQQRKDNYALIGIGAFVPVEHHKAIVQGVDESLQPRMSRTLGYGAVLNQ